MVPAIDRIVGLKYGWRDIALGVVALTLAVMLGLFPLSWSIVFLAVPFALALVILDPLWGLYALVLSVPVQKLVVLPMGLTVTQLVAGLALLAWLLRMLLHRDVRLPRPLLLPWLAFLLALVVAASLSNYSVDQSIKELGRWIAAFLAFELAVANVTSPRRALGLIACLLLAPLSEAFIGLWQFFTGTGPESFLVGQYARAYGTFGKPNPLAGYLNMAWPLALGLAGGLLVAGLRRRSKEYLTVMGRKIQSAERPPLVLAGLVCGSAAITLLAALGATYSRGGWVGAAAGLLVMVALINRRTALLGGSLAAVLLLVLIAGGEGDKQTQLSTSISGRAKSIINNARIFDASKANVNDANFAIVERMAHWQAGWYMFLDHPLDGVGPGNYYLAYNDYFVGNWYISKGHAHNYYIHSAAETGALGLVTYLLLIACISYSALRAVLHINKTIWRAIAIGCCGIIASVVMHNVFENLHVLNMGIQLSAVWGLLVWLNEWSRAPAGGNPNDLSDYGRGGLYRQPPDRGIAYSRGARHLPG